MGAAEPDDEMLMRLADGELPAAEAEALRARIAGEPRLAERYALFATTRQALAATLAPLAAAPPPDRLVAAILAADAARPPGEERADGPPGGQVVPFARPARRPRPSWVGLAIAASVATLLAAPVGYLLGRGDAPAGFADAAGRAGPLLQAALEATPSGERRAEGPRAVRPLATHAVPGGVCRDFLLESPDGALLGLACRDDGGWRLRLGVPLDASEALRPAAADHPLLAAALERLGASAPLDAASEAALLRRGWR
jgi:hypothetical protein